MDIISEYEAKDEESTVRATDVIRAIEVASKMLGYNEADKGDTSPTVFEFKLG